MRRIVYVTRQYLGSVKGGNVFSFCKRGFRRSPLVGRRSEFKAVCCEARGLLSLSINHADTPAEMVRVSFSLARFLCNTT